ncbi:MAG: WD40 repeat domain-containing protein, partial [Planctomycetaceae bacterium]|nr:WD40 repeat domain-containing protein [Planctomycetaceae bacterium]
LASASHDGSAKIWDMESGSVLRTLVAHSGRVNAVSYSHRGDRIATAGDDTTVRIWDAASGELVHTCQGHEWFVYDVQFSPDDSYLVSASIDESAILWDADSGERISSFRQHNDAQHVVAIRPDGKQVATGGWDGSVQFFDPETGESRSDSDAVGYRGGVAVNPSGTLVGTGMWDGSVQLLRLPDQQRIARLEGHSARVHTVEFSVDGKTLYSASDSFGVSNLCRWDVTSHKLLNTFDHSDGRSRAMAVSPDGRLIAFGSDDGEVYVYDAKNGAQRSRFQHHSSEVRCLGFSADSQLLVAGNDLGDSVVFDLATSQVLHIIPHSSQKTMDAVFSPDGTHLISCGGSAWGPGYVDVTNLSTGSSVAHFQGHARELTSVSFSPDGRAFATTAIDGFIRVWRWPDCELLQEIDVHGPYGPVWNCAFSPGGRHLVTTNSDGTASVFRLSEQPGGRIQSP